VTAYLLNLGDVLPADFTLSERNIREVQQRLPNRNGVTTDHALWPGNEFAGRNRPDVTGSACMKDCAPEAKLTSVLPAFARNSHGNLAEQNRIVGPQRGIDTGASTVAQASAVPSAAGPAVQALTQKNNCTACHALDRRVLGPSWTEVAARHAGKPDYIAAKIRSGGAGVWGTIPMPPQQLGEAEARQIADWLAAGAGK
jgi:cytochrome c